MIENEENNEFVQTRTHDAKMRTTRADLVKEGTANRQEIPSKQERKIDHRQKLWKQHQQVQAAYHQTKNVPKKQNADDKNKHPSMDVEKTSTSKNQKYIRVRQSTQPRKSLVHHLKRDQREYEKPRKSVLPVDEIITRES